MSLPLFWRIDFSSALHRFFHVSFFICTIFFLTSICALLNGFLLSSVLLLYIYIFCPVKDLFHNNPFVLIDVLSNH